MKALAYILMATGLAPGYGPLVAYEKTPTCFNSQQKSKNESSNEKRKLCAWAKTKIRNITALFKPNGKNEHVHEDGHSAGAEREHSMANEQQACRSNVLEDPLHEHEISQKNDPVRASATEESVGLYKVR